MKSDKEPEIKVITDDEESLKIIGELLSNNTSRDLLKFLMNKSAYKKKIADENGVPFSLVEHHLKKMEKVGLVKITNKKLIKGGVLHKTYKITAEGIFILLNSNDEIEKKGTLKRVFREGVKFASIGIAAIISYIIPYQFSQRDTWSNGDYVNVISLELPLMIIIIGLVMERIYSYIKNKKRK